MNLASLLRMGLVGAPLLASQSMAFSPMTARRTHGHIRTSGQVVAAPTPTALRSIVFEPPVEDNCELDSTACEESIFDRKRREKAEADDAIQARYRMEGIELSAIDLTESVDQYQNSPVGGNLIPGLSLSALCEDD